MFCAGLQVKKVREPHPGIGCWWTLYDYGLEKVKTWPKDYVHPYPGASPHLYPPSRCQFQRTIVRLRQEAAGMLLCICRKLGLASYLKCDL